MMAVGPIGDCVAIVWPTDTRKHKLSQVFRMGNLFILGNIC
jgi:hypothetical protein